MLFNFRNNIFRNVVLSSLLFTTGLTAVDQPTDCTMGTNAVNFTININKKIEKLKKSKNSSKRISRLLSIKRECERFLDVKFNLKDSFKEVENILYSHGICIDENFEDFKKEVKKKNKNHNKKWKLFGTLLQQDPTGELFLQQYQMKAYPHEQMESDAVEAYETGITFVLVGLFLKWTPNAYCQSMSPFILGLGTQMIINQYEIDKAKRREERHKYRD